MAPNQPKNKAYAFRLNPERIDALMEQAKAEGGINLSEVVRNAIDAYLDNPPKPTPTDDQADEQQ